MNKLSEEQVQKLIDFVEARPALYHKGHPGYKKVEQKERLWKEIASNLSADEKDCKGAWRCLKDQFVRRSKELKGKTGQSANEVTTKYKNFERLLFLKDSLEPRKHCSNFDDEINELFDYNSETIVGDYDFSEVTEIRTVPVPEISPSYSGYLFPKNSSSTSRKMTARSEPFDLDILNSASNSRKRTATTRSEQFDFEFSASPSNKTAVPAVSPAKVNYATDSSFSTSSTFAKRKKTENINDEFSGFLKKLTNSIEWQEPDNVDSFFESIAKSAKAFKLTPIEMSKLMFGTTELLHKIVANREGA